MENISVFQIGIFVIILLALGIQACSIRVKKFRKVPYSSREQLGAAIDVAAPIILTSFLLSGCMLVPQTDMANVNRCEISSDRKTLKIINGFEDTNTFYSVSGLILLPISGIVSGSYVVVNNVYHLGEELIVCGAQ
jgi:hypothetical protein